MLVPLKILCRKFETSLSIPVIVIYAVLRVKKLKLFIGQRM